MRDAAAGAIGALIGKVKSPEFVQLDGACRNEWAYESSETSAWRRLKPDEVKQFWPLPSPVTVIGVASFHINGFVRDAAVNELANSFDGPELPFLLVRLNDWVQAVRESAAKAVRRRIRPDYAPHFLRHLRLVLRLHSCGRAGHKGIIAQIELLLSDPGAAAVLREGIQSGDAWVRRESFRLAIAGDAEQRPALIRELVGARDPFLRLWAARYVLVRLNDLELKPTLPALIRDRFMAVRCEALNLLARRFASEALTELLQALLDSHASVRAVARHWIRAQQPRFDFAARYRESLSERSTALQRAAILGLAETGTPADVVVIAPFLRSPLVSTRKAAIQAVAKLNVDAHLDELVALLRNEHPGISNEAMRALLRRANSVIDQLQPLFDRESQSHVRKNVFKLLVRQSFWRRGIFLLETLRDPEPALASLARTAARDWINRSRSMGAGPTSTETRDLRAGLKASAKALTAEQIRELEFCLATYEGS